MELRLAEIMFEKRKYEFVPPWEGTIRGPKRGVKLSQLKKKLSRYSLLGEQY